MHYHGHVVAFVPMFTYLHLKNNLACIIYAKELFATLSIVNVTFFD
jgi:hypothetical protein